MELNDTDFISRPKHSAEFLEAVIYNKDDRHLRVGGLEWSKLDDWLNLAGEYASEDFNQSGTKSLATIRILHVPWPGHPLTIGMGKYEWQKVSTKFQLHRFTAEAFLNKTGVQTKYFYKTSPKSPTVERMEFLVKVPNKKSIGFDAVALSYHFPTQRIRVVYHGGEQASWEMLVGLIHSLQHLLEHPLLFLVLVFVNHVHSAAIYRDRVDNQILQVERETGYGVAGIINNPQVHLTKKQFNTESALVRLQSCQTELAGLSHVLRFNQTYADFLFEGIETLDKLYEANEQELLGRSSEDLIHLLELPRSQTGTASSQVQSLKERVASQTNLIFSLISSEENRINQLVSEASTKVAVASKRDSLAMKTIAVLTMLFLPATFVAAFFSMPMFEWDAGTGAPSVASPYIWMYWVITVPLTMTLFVGWYFWSKSQEKASEAELEIAMKRDKEQISGVVGLNLSQSSL